MAEQKPYIIEVRNMSPRKFHMELDNNGLHESFSCSLDTMAMCWAIGSIVISSGDIPEQFRFSMPLPAGNKIQKFFNIYGSDHRYRAIRIEYTREKLDIKIRFLVLKKKAVAYTEVELPDDGGDRE